MAGIGMKWKKPLKPTTIKRQLAKLEAMGVDTAIVAISTALECGWIGVFEPKENGKVESGESVFDRKLREAQEKAGAQ